MNTSEIHDFIEELGLKNPRSFSKMLTPHKRKQAVFDKRFFSGWTFQRIGEAIGVTSAQAGSIYSRLVDKVDEMRYLREKTCEHEETGRAVDIEVQRLPCKQKFKSACENECIKYLHELTTFSKRHFGSIRNVGKNTLAEAEHWLSVFGFEFLK